MIWLLATLGCVTDDWQPTEAPPVVPGEPVVGAAEGYLVLPVGTPLSGYTARCTCLGGYASQVDDRDSPYTTSFIESAGVQTYPVLKAIWVENGDQHLVITKTDSIYAADALVAALTERLEAATDLDLKGKVVLTANHSHSSYGDYAPGITWFLGSDKFNREIFERFADQLAEVALRAYEQREPAKIGVGWAKDWDPNDEVYRDRRGDNNDLTIWPDGPQLLKDPHLGVIRFDDADDEPLAMVVNFGMHGILGNVDNPLVSTDSGGGLEAVLEEQFDEEVVVMYTQGSGGDVSPAGSQRWFARMESIGEHAVDKILPVYEAIETSSEPISLQVASRHVWKHPSIIQVTRNGEVDWRYAPFEADRLPDNEVYESDGSLISEIDEFNTEYGAVFCGSGDLDFPVGGLDAEVFPYGQCMQVELLSSLIEVFFKLDEVSLPLDETLKAGTTTARLGPVPTHLPDGQQVVQDLFVGFFPGEPVYSYGEQWRRRVEAELGYTQPMMFGYSQDHEGYLLLPEDWLVGGYEPDITVWGPLEAEHVMENVLAYSAELLSNDVHDDPDPLGHYAPTEYPDVPLPTLRPDPTPQAGARITDQRPYLWTPYVLVGDEEEPQAPTVDDLTIPAQVPRVQGLIQLAWEGGDPMVDAPRVVLERLEGGAWEPVRSRAGRIIDEGRHDILVAHTPTPLFPADAEQTHQWWAAWQAVGHVHDRAGLPVGTYRLHVTGQRYAGQAQTWPWDAEPYELFSDAFEVVPGVISVEEDAAGLSISLPAPARGFRLVAMGGDNAGDNPVSGTVTVAIETPADTSTQDVATEPAHPRSRVPVTLPADWISVTVTDAWGNTGTLIRP